jgi:HD-like signal output (HDOD) protein/predicted Ser/Thr protein kinase
MTASRSGFINPAPGLLSTAAWEGRSDSLLEQMLADPRLPSPPMVALRIVQKVSDPECEVADVCDLLVQDPGLCGNVLKAANSFILGGNNRVTSVKRAVVIAGLNRLRLMALGLSLPAIQGRVKADRGLTRYWQNSVTSAIIAWELSTKLGSSDPDDELTAALLCDVGMMLIRQYAKDTYWPVWSGQFGILGTRQCEWEKEIFGFDHTEAGTRLLKKWGLPDDMADPIRYHHSPESVPDSSPSVVRRVHLLDLANRLALLNEADQPVDVIQETLGIAEKRFSLKFADLEELLTRAQPKIEEFARLLNVDIGSHPDLGVALEQGSRTLARLSFESKYDPLASRAAVPPSRFKPPSNSQSGEAKDVDLASPEFQWGLDGEYSLYFLELLGRPNTVVRIRNFQLVEKIGQGAMGVVFKGQDRTQNRLVAIKMMIPGLARVPTALNRFAREARLAAAIRHDNVVETVAITELRGTPVLVMEFINGRSLQDYLDSGRAFTVKEIVRIGQQIASGLTAAHGLHLIHRDIKPANILLEDNTNRVRITDFGLARDMRETSSLTSHGVPIGTPSYMSPEQADGDVLDQSTDLFSLGTILYTLCTGQVPFMATSVLNLLQVISTSPVPIRTLNSQIPEWLEQFIGRLHSLQRKDRPTAVEVSHFLAQRLKSLE